MRAQAAVVTTERNSLAGGRCRRARGVDALADGSLVGIPACRDDLVKGIGSDGGWLEDDRLDGVSTRCLEVLRGVARRRCDRRIDGDRDLGDLLALAELEGCLAGRLAQLIAVLADVHILLAESHAVQVG